MARARRHPPLRVYQNDQLVGHLLKESGGAIEFRYAQEWLGQYRVSTFLTSGVPAGYQQKKGTEVIILS